MMMMMIVAILVFLLVLMCRCMCPGPTFFRSLFVAFRNFVTLKFPVIFSRSFPICLYYGRVASIKDETA
jgi:hypothetical protein